MNKLFLAFLIAFTSAQALALPLAPEIIDQIELVDQVYNVVVDDIINVDETSGFEVKAGKKSGYLDIRLSVYKENNTEFTRRQGSGIFLSTFKVCDEIAKNPKSHAYFLEQGYELDFKDDMIGESIDGVLSADKKTYSCGCEVPYLINKL